jgi:hypothetical protein
MILTTVNSRAIHAIGYDYQSHQMEVIFSGGGIYRYENVPASVYRDFLRADSKGGYFRENVMGNYHHQRLGRYNTGRLVQRRRYASP